MSGIFPIREYTLVSATEVGSDLLSYVIAVKASLVQKSKPRVWGQRTRRKALVK